MSQSIRINMLNESCDEFPIYFVLLKTSTLESSMTTKAENNGVPYELIGHCKLIAPMRQYMIVESVIISPNKRGQGLGKLLMNKLTEYILQTVLHQSMFDGYLYLSTHDQMKFYEKCNFQYCTLEQIPRVTKSVCSSLSPNGINNLLSLFGEREQQIQPRVSSGKHVQIWMRKKL